MILQGHLDMVCEKTSDCDIDFNKDGLRLVLDGDMLSADGTTLGADDGIAVAMILAVLEDEQPPRTRRLRCFSPPMRKRECTAPRVLMYWRFRAARL